jgi:spore coat polysaccharide biosynthesis protein SpsF
VVIVRCDGNETIGMGHVSRCLALAEELRDTHGCTVFFAVRGEESAGAAAVRAAGYAVVPVAAGDGADYGGELRELAASHDASAVVCDVRDGLSRASLDSIRERDMCVVSIDDGTERRLAADLAFYPPAPQVEEMDWRGFTGQRYAGWDWVLLRREFARGPSPGASGARAFGTSGARAFDASRTRASGASGARAFQASDAGSSESLALDHSESPAIDILVTMGGSDPAGMTEFAVGALELLPMPLAVRIVVGPVFSRAEPLIDAIAHSKHALQIARSPASLAPLMRASRMAVAAFGVTAYELAACGVPAVHVCLTADHARASGAFDREGAAVTAGVFGEVTPEQIAGAVRRLMGAAGRRGQMAQRGAQLVDGRGAERVAALVAAGLA